MNGEQVIPPITDPLGVNWRQPHRRYIELDESHALMSEQTFKGLMEYSCTFPSGKYYGKMWKAQRGDKWFLAWYCPDKNPTYVGIEWREILILNLKDMKQTFNSICEKIQQRFPNAQIENVIMLADSIVRYRENLPKQTKKKPYRAKDIMAILAQITSNMNLFRASRK